jgi:alkylhydroperoxidase family enzyme
MGWTEDQVQNMVDFEMRDDFTPREKAALRLTERMTLDPHGIDDAQWAELRNHFNEGEVLELLAAIGLFNYFNRFNEVLKMQPSAVVSSK